MNPIKGKDYFSKLRGRFDRQSDISDSNAAFLCTSLSLKFYDFWGKVQHLSGSKLVAEN